MSGKEAKLILLVEDDFLIALDEAAKLEDYGYEVLSAVSGDEALELFRAEPSINLVLMDIDLGRGA